MRSLALIAALALAGCYPEPEPDKPNCSVHGVTVDAEPGTGACVFALRDVDGFVRRFQGFGGVRISNVDGFVVGSKALPSDRGGETDCANGRIWLTRIPQGLTHELVHAGENCARDEDAGTAYEQMHPKWDARQVYAAIYEAEQ